MAKGKAPRTKAWKRPRGARLAQLAREFYYWRYHEDEDDSPLQTRRAGLQEPSGFKDTRLADIFEYEVQQQALYWHCLTITYCRGNWDKKYLSLGYAKSGDRMRLVEDSAEPVLKAALKESEQTLNQKHVYARGVLIAPRSPENHDLMRLVRAQRHNLHLKASDLERIQDFIESDDNVYYEGDYVPNFSVEERIAELLD